MYVGQTTQKLNKRWNGHITDAKQETKRPFPLAIKEYGRENFSINEVEKCFSRVELNKKEVWWMKYFNTLFPNGYNLIDYRMPPNLKNIKYKRPRAKLKDEEVLEVKKLLLENVPHKEIAKKFEVKTYIIATIASEECYRDIPWPNETKYKKWKEENSISKTPEEIVIKIKQMLAEGKKIPDVARSLNIDYCIVKRIKNNKHYKEIPWSKDFCSEEYVSATFKLTENDVIEIKKLIVIGKTNKEIGEIYNVSKTTISSIKCERSWKNIPWPKNYISTIKKRKRLGEKDVIEIKKLILEEISFLDIAKEFKISEGTIRFIYRNLIWKHIPWESEEKLQLLRKKRMERKQKGNTSKNLSKELVLKIRKLKKEGKKYKEIEKIIGVSYYVIERICQGRTYKDVK